MSRVHLTALGLLHERPMHGYELQQIVRERHLDHWAFVNPNSVYKALQALQDKGYIAGHEETEGNAPPRTVFHITDTGRDELARLVRSFLSHSTHPHDFWLGIAFVLGLLTRRELLGYIDDHIARLEEHVSTEEVKAGEALQRFPDMPFNWRMLINMGQSMSRTMLACLRDLRQATIDCDTPMWFKPETPTTSEKKL